MRQATGSVGRSVASVDRWITISQRDNKPTYLNQPTEQANPTPTESTQGVDTTALAELIGQEKGLGTVVHCAGEDDVFALASTLNVRAHLEVGG